jgi:hypothetical protein
LVIGDWFTTMVVEHTFITTLEGHDALRMAWELLVARGFVPLPPNEAAQRPQSPSAVELRRGRENPDRAKSVVEFPQFVRVEWDRGRVTVAAAITPRTAWGRQYTPGSIISKPLNARDPDQENLVLAVVGALELLLGHRRAPAEAVAGLDQVQHQLVETARKKRVRNWLILLGVIVAFIAFIVFISMYAR